jgi:hypothetical protein
MTPRSLVLVGVLVLLSSGACNDDGPFEVTVTAEVVSSNSQVEMGVVATAVTLTEDSTYSHGVRVTWRGNERVLVSTPRFVHRYKSDDAAFIIAGYLCWPVEHHGEQIVFCSGEGAFSSLEPNETHEYPITLYPDEARCGLARGTYVFEQLIRGQGLDFGPPRSGQVGEFTIRLTYEVR